MISEHLAVAWDVTDCLTKLVVKEKIRFSPLILISSEEDPCSRYHPSNASKFLVSSEVWNQMAVSLHGGSYHSSYLQRGRNRTLALRAGQQQRAHIFVQTNPRAAAAFPSAGKQEEKQGCVLRVLSFFLSDIKEPIFKEPHFSRKR